MALMRTTRRLPLSELEDFGSRLNNLFPSFVAGNGWSSVTEFVPAVSVEESGEELVLTAELPGMAREDVEIEFENNVLTIRGEKASGTEQTDEGRRYHVWERRYGSFQRSFTLPRTVRSEDISADFENGVLTVRMPKSPEAKSRRIQIGTPA